MTTGVIYAIIASGMLQSALKPEHHAMHKRPIISLSVGAPAEKQRRQQTPKEALQKRVVSCDTQPRADGVEERGFLTNSLLDKTKQDEAMTAGPKSTEARDSVAITRSRRPMR